MQRLISKFKFISQVYSIFSRNLVPRNFAIAFKIKPNHPFRYFNFVLFRLARRKTSFAVPSSYGGSNSGWTGRAGKSQSDFFPSLAMNFKTSGFRKFVTQYQQVGTTELYCLAHFYGRNTRLTFLMKHKFYFYNFFIFGSNRER